jgi:hypothetical protein
MTRTAIRALLIAALATAACATGPQRYHYDDRGVAARPGPKLAPLDADGRAQLGPDRGRELRKGNLEDYPERPMLSPGRDQAWAMFLVCVSKQGIVESVSVQRSPGSPDMSDQWMSVIRTWRYQSYEDGDGRHPFCYPQRLEVKAD